jgi:hypothetical protein
MTSDTLSSLTGSVFETSARTAGHFVQAFQRSGEKVVGKIDTRWESGLARRAARLSPKLRSDLVNAEREITGFYTRGATTLTQAAQRALAQASRLAVTQVDRLAATATRLQPVLGTEAAERLRVLAMPTARALSDLTHVAAKQAIRLTDRVIGSVEATAVRAPARAKRALTRKGSRRAA